MKEIKTTIYETDELINEFPTFSRDLELMTAEYEETRSRFNESIYLVVLNIACCKIQIFARKKH